MGTLSLCICYYNSIKYIKRCLDSIVNSLDDNIELILVNDGSNDGSDCLVKDYLNRYVKTTYKHIHHEHNVGLFRARETAINNSRNDYILFFDSDDEFLYPPFEEFFKIIDKKRYDIIEFRAKTEYGSELKRQVNQTVISSELYLKHLFTKKGIASSLCVKIISRELFIPFPNTDSFIKYDDIYLLPSILKNAKEVYVTSTPFLLIHPNINSITRKMNSKRSREYFVEEYSFYASYFKYICKIYSTDFSKEFNFYKLRLLIKLAQYSIYNNKSEIKELLVDCFTKKNELKNRLKNKTSRFWLYIVHWVRINIYYLSMSILRTYSRIKNLSD